MPLYDVILRDVIMKYAYRIRKWLNDAVNPVVY